MTNKHGEIGMTENKDGELVEARFALSDGGIVYWHGPKRKILSRLKSTRTDSEYLSLLPETEYDEPDDVVYVNFSLVRYIVFIPYKSGDSSRINEVSE